MKTTRTRLARWVLSGSSVLALALTLLAAPIAWAQETAAGGSSGLDWGHVLRGVVETLIFGALGILLLLGGYRAFSATVPWNVNKELEADHNVAVAIVIGSLFLGLSIIIAAVLLS